jgi:hypothetical protein
MKYNSLNVFSTLIISLGCVKEKEKKRIYKVIFYGLHMVKEKWVWSGKKERVNVLDNGPQVPLLLQ